MKLSGTWPRPLAPSKLRAWHKYHATKGAYCPCCGEKFVDDQQWLWVLPDRVYFICEEDALGWADGLNVVEPAKIPAFLASRQWLSSGHGLELTDGQKPLPQWEDPTTLLDAIMMITWWLEWRSDRTLFTTGFREHAQKLCAQCKADLPKEARHLFRHERGEFLSYYVCPSCSDRWDAIGDATVYNCLPECLNWSLWKPQPIDLTRCGDCCVPFSAEAPAKGLAIATGKGPLNLLCEPCTGDWQKDPHLTPGLSYRVMPVPAVMQ